MNHAKLFKLCQGIFDTFNPSRTTEEVHADEFLTENKITDEADITFLKEMFYGMTRYKKLLSQTFKAYNSVHKEALISDKTQYYMIAYLVLFRLKELGMLNFKKLLTGSLSVAKIANFLNWLIDEKQIREYLVPKWQTLYDINFIEEKLIATLREFKAPLLEYISYLEQVALGKDSKKQEREKQFTQPEPFNLTKPKPKKIPPPLVIKATFQTSSVPETTFVAPKTVQKVLDAYKKGKLEPLLDEETIAENRKKEMEKYEDSKVPFQEIRKRKSEAKEYKSKEPKPLLETLPIKLNVATKLREEAIVKEKLKKQEEEKRKQEEANLQIKDPSEVQKILNKEPAKVRLTAATILREDAIYKKKQMSEMKILQQYETELRDASEFYTWQEQMKMKDEEERKRMIEQRKLEMMLTDERARKAREMQDLQNLEDARRMKEVTREELEKQKQILQAEINEKRERAEELVSQIREAVKKAKKEVKEEKIKRAKKLKEESRMNEIKVAEMIELERQRKEELIKQIKAIVSIPSMKTTPFDPTETSGLGLLNEMSLVELKERLEKLKEQRKQEEEEKRKEIAKEKLKKESEMLEKIRKISEFRKLKQRENIKRKLLKEKEKKEEEERMKLERDEKLLELQKKLQEHREQRKRERQMRIEEAKKRRMKQQFLGADKYQYEEKHWAEQELGAEREAKTRTEKNKMAQDLLLKTKEKENKIRKMNRKKENAILEARRRRL